MRTIIHQSAPVSLNLTCYDSPDRLLYSLAVQPLHMQLVSLRMALTPQFLLMPHDSFPQLQTLDLTIIWAGLFTDTKMISTYTAASCFLGMRNLHTLRLCFKDDVDAVPDTIPWSQITSLTLVSDDIESGADALGVDNVLSILKQSFSLRKCHLHLAMDNVTHSSMVTLPNLRELEVQHHTYGGEYEGSLLDLLITPALGSLSLETTADYRDSFEIPDFRSLILRSGCHLHLLSLDQTWLELSDADLHSISSVQSLYVPHVFFDTEMLSQVVNGNLLPAIENISLGVESIEHIELLTELIERRSECALKEENHLQVKEVRIAFAYDKANMKAMMRCLKLAKRCGTKLCIYDGQKSWSEKYVSLEEDDGVSQGNSGKE
ncbi:hypothetical protein H0H93_004451 [Arthromyces matolae]|nr:hypothetical protein H0H93_004451 [Arthromyces matolae]